MAYGFRCWNASGSLLIDTNSRLSRVLGVYVLPTGPTTGTIVNADFAQGTPWWACTGGGIGVGFVNITPVISVSGNTLSWDWDGNPRTAVTLIYGVY